MPLPSPKSNEEKKDFISRCVSNNIMKSEFADNKQRVAVCYSLFKRKDEATETIDKLNNIEQKLDMVSHIEDLQEGNAHTKTIKRISKGEKFQYYDYPTGRFKVYIKVEGDKGLTKKRNINSDDKERIEAVQNANHTLNEYLGTSILKNEEMTIIFRPIKPNEKDGNYLGRYIDTKEGEDVILIEEDTSKFKTNGLQGTIIHEIGHALWRRIEQKRKDYFKRWFAQIVEGKDAKELIEKGIIPTLYSSSDDEECFCEIFVYFGMFPDFLNDETFSVFHKTIEKNIRRG